MDKQSWSMELAAFATAQRLAEPPPDPQGLSGEARWRFEVIGASLIQWYNVRYPSILAERGALPDRGFDPDPTVVITTESVGLAVIEQLFEGHPDPPVAIIAGAFDAWLERHPVDSFTFHVQHLNFFTPPPPRLAPRIHEAAPDVPPAEVRLHVEGDLWGLGCGIRGHHLWRWAGEEAPEDPAQLLQAAFERELF